MQRRALVVAIVAVIGGACSGPSFTPGVPPSSAPAPSAVPGTAGQPTPSAAPTLGLHERGFAMLTAEAADVFTAPHPDAPRLMMEVFSDVVSGEVPVTFGTSVGMTRFFLAEGPTPVDGHDWWRVAPTHDRDGIPQTVPSALVGWIDGGAPGSSVLAPLDPCPPYPPDLSTLIPPTSTWALGLGCFGDEPLTLRGWWAGLPGEPGAGCEIVPAFLCTTYAVFPVIRNWDGPGNEVRFDFHLAPSTGATLPEPGRWVRITGRFDDPLAATCPADGDLGDLTCRYLFIVSEVRPG